MTAEEILKGLQGRCPSAARVEPGVKAYPTIKLPAEGLLAAVRWLKEEMGFGYLDMVAGVDYAGPVDARGYVIDPNPNAFLPEGATPQIEAAVRAPNFPYRDVMEVVYCLSNLRERIKLFLKVEIPRQDPKVPSLVSLYKTADWQERETFDLFGIRFEGHPNLSKILTPDFIQGYPLRKDYVHVKDRFD